MENKDHDPSGIPLRPLDQPWQQPQSPATKRNYSAVDGDGGYNPHRDNRHDHKTSDYELEPEPGSHRWQEREAASQRLLLKIDLHLLPCLISMYLLNFLDRSNLAQARQGSLEKDLGMSGTDFNLATSVFFVGYIAMQLPSNLLITKVRPSLYLGACTMLWGVVSTCNAAVHNMTGLVALRFMLGFVEAPMFPGAVFLMSSWYTRSELTKRMSWFYTGNSLANMFGGLLGAGILGNLEGAHGISGWRWLFIIEGSMTIGVAVIIAFILPDYPLTTTWLTEEERNLAAWRLMHDLNETEEEGKASGSIIEGVKLALRDYRTYLFVLLQHTAILSLTFQYFFPSIVGTLGYGPIETLWLTAPVWFAAFVISIIVTWSSARTGDRSIHIIVLMLVAAVGNAIATGTPNTGARFFAMFLMPMGAVSAYQIVVSWIANSFPRPVAKRSSIIALCNMFGNTASIYGSYMYPASAAPRYIPGGTGNTLICVVVAGVALGLRFVHLHENKKLARTEEERARSGTVATRGADTMATGFRYVY